MSWSLRLRVVECPSHVDPRRHPCEEAVPQGAVVEFQLTNDRREVAVAARRGASWPELPTLTITDSQTAGPFPATSREAPLFFRYRFSWPGHKYIRVAGRFRHLCARTGVSTTTAVAPEVVLEPVDVRLELDIAPDPLSEPGRIRSTTMATSGSEVRALDRSVDEAARSRRVVERAERTFGEQRREAFHQLRDTRLQARLPRDRRGVVPWPYLGEAGLRNLTDDEAAAYLYGLGTMVEVTRTAGVLDLRSTTGWLSPDQTGERIALLVVYHARIEEQPDGTIEVWEQPIAAGHIPLTAYARNRRRYHSDDLLAVRYAEDTEGGGHIIRASDLARQIAIHTLQYVAWLAVEFVVADLVFRGMFFVLPIIGGLLRAAIARLASAAGQLGARLLAASVRLEARLALAESSRIVEAALEARATGGRLASETEHGLAGVARARGLFDESMAQQAARSAPRPDAATPFLPELFAEGAELAVTGAVDGAALAGDSGGGTLVAMMRGELDAAITAAGLSVRGLRAAVPVVRGRMMERVGYQLLNRRALEALQSFRIWRYGRLVRYTRAIHEGITSWVGQDLYGVGRQMRGAESAGWTEAAEVARAQGIFDPVQSGLARQAGPMAAELKTVSGETPPSLGGFGPPGRPYGLQMDINYVVDRWTNWSTTEGEVLVRQWIRDRRLHPYWAHPGWVRLNGAAFQQNRVVIVFSRLGNFGIRNARNAGLEESQILRIAVDYLE
jgi:hypothetical protein